MKFDSNTPCQDCPYRKDAPLAKWDRSEFKNLLDYEDDYMGKTWSCHKKDDQVCRGHLMNEQDRDYPHIAVRLMLLNNNVKRDYLESLHCSSDRYASLQEMCEANFPGITLDY